MPIATVKQNPVIYKITSPSGKVYIGQSRDFILRKKYYEKNKCKSQPKLYNSLLKYGFASHRIEILEEFDYAITQGELNQKEQHYVGLFREMQLPLLNLIYNCQNGGFHSDETKIKISQSLKGTILSEQHRKNVSIGNTGKKMSEIAKIRMSLAAMGNKKGLGTKRTDEQRKKISDAAKGRKMPMMLGENNPSKRPEVREKIRLSKIEFWKNKKQVHANRNNQV